MGESINKRHKQIDIKIILKKENLAEEANNKMRKKIPNKKVESKEKSKSNMRENPEQRERERERERDASPEMNLKKSAEEEEAPGGVMMLGGVPPILYVPTFPWVYFFSTK
jgi:hypothetical protein